MTTRKTPIVAGKKAVQDRIPGINRVTAKLANGREAVYYYHRATGTKLPGAYGSDEFLQALADAKAGAATRRTAGTLSGLIRSFEGTAKWRKLRDTTKKEYKRVFKFWDGKFGTVPVTAIAAKGFREDVLEWHDEFSEDHPREADNRVTILARVLSWAASDRSLKANVLEGFDRAYSADRADKIWLPEHIDAFLTVARPEMQLAVLLALHTGQRQGDVRRMAWTNYDGEKITLRQSKTGALVVIPCTAALKATLDGLPRKGTVILTTATGIAYKPDYFKKQFRKARDDAKVGDLHFHDLRGTAVTMLFEAGCNVAEVAAITGHTLKSAQSILDQYLARTGNLARSAIIKLEHRMETERAKRSAK
jgi:integrase